jgi:hypothetical protein
VGDRAIEKSVHDCVLHTVMHENILAIAARLSDDALLARLKVLSLRERDATVELDARKTHLGEGPGSLFVYCRDDLHLSEDAAWNRAATANVVRRYPVILDWLADGSLTVTTVRVLRPVLTPENHLAVLAEARHRSKKEAELIVARLKPQPDVAPSIRKLPAPTPVTSPPVAMTPQEADSPRPPQPVVPAPAHRPVVVPLAPERYRVQFTVSKETHDKLRRVQDLLCREIPNGDPAAIFDRALDLLLREVERKKIAATTKPGRPRATKPATVENISLRCRAHNVYESELVFGRYDPSVIRETPENYAVSGEITPVPERRIGGSVDPPDWRPSPQGAQL